MFSIFPDLIKKEFLSWARWLTHVIPYVRVQGWPWAKSFRLYLKKTKAKMVEGMAQVVECLLNKCEALNSNPSTAKTIKNKKESQPSCPEFYYSLLSSLCNAANSGDNGSQKLQRVLEIHTHRSSATVPQKDFKLCLPTTSS
jgi:hypothetical protein